MTENCSRWISKLLLLVSVLGPEVAWSQENSVPSEIEPQSYEISFEGLPNDLRTEIAKKFDLVDGGRASGALADDILKFLHLQLNGDLVELVEFKPKQLKFRRVLRVRISSLDFSGFKAVTAIEAQNILGIQKDDLFDLDLLVRGAEKIRQTYTGKGFMSAQIDIEYPTNSEGQIELKITVRENLPTRIRSLSFETENKLIRERLESRTKKYLGNTLTQEESDSILRFVKDLLKREKFSRAEVSPPVISLSADETLASLSFKLDKIERYEYRFRGNSFLSTRRILDGLDLENFYSANRNVGPELAQKLRNLYFARGYARAEIQTEETSDEQRFTRTVTFDIFEGPKIKIDKIQIYGSYSREESEYIKLFLELAPEMLKKKIYAKDDLEIATNNLRLALQNSGYLLAKIQTVRAPYNKEKDRVSILISLEEGPLTQIETLSFEGHKLWPEDSPKETLTAITGLSLNSPLNLQALEKSIESIKTAYRSRGFLEMTLRNEKTDLVTYSANNERAHLRFEIFEGPLVKVNSIVIEGNRLTRNSVIVNELEFAPGDVLTPQKIEDSKMRLQRTGHFASVEIRTIEEKTAISERTVLIRVTERDPGVFNMGFGVTNERKLTLRGYAGIAYRNILGTGRGISLRTEGNYNVAEIKYPEYKITVGYLEPNVFSKKNRGRINVTRSRLVTDFTARKATESIQTAFSLERDLTPHITGVWEAYTMSSSRDFGIDNQIPEVLLDIATTGFTLDVDYRDNPFNPTAGTLSKLSVEYGSPALRSTPTVEFWKSSASLTHYLAFFKSKFVWANQLRGGYLQNLSRRSDGGVPYDKKGFILGGRSTIRGYEAGTDEVFPNSNDLGVNSGESFLLKGWAQMGLFKSEARFPIYGNFAGAVFYDGGLVKMSDREFSDSYRDSVGIGFRYNTPVGPLSLEFGWKLDRRAGEDAGRYHLSFGTF